MAKSYEDHYCCGRNCYCVFVSIPAIIPVLDVNGGVKQRLAIRGLKLTLGLGIQAATWGIGLGFKRWLDTVHLGGAVFIAKT